MSSSIPLAYLAARKESEGPSISRASRRISSDQVSGDSTQLPALSSDGQVLDDIEPDEHAIETVPGIEFEEGGYGWVVTGCEFPRQNTKKQTHDQAHSP